MQDFRNDFRVRTAEGKCQKMNIKDRMIMEEYREQKDDFARLGEIVHSRLSRIVKNAGIPVMSIAHRIKDEKSLEGKLYRKGDGYQSLKDITDILGARVICYFNDDVDKIGQLVEESFKIDRERSSDKRALMRADAFGYLSLHYICSLPEDEDFPEELCGRRFEIQIRTILQHAWSDINHDLGYKNQFGVPRAITRELARLAGLLELADNEFVRVRDDMNSYIEETRRKIVEDNADDVLIDMISLDEYMKGNARMREFLGQLASIENSEISEVNPEAYIQQLKWLKMETIGDIQKMLERNRELAFRLAERVLKGSELDILASNVALRFLCRAELLSGGYTMEQAAEFIALSVNKKERAERQAQRLFKTYEEIKKEEGNGLL